MKKTINLILIFLMLGFARPSYSTTSLVLNFGLVNGWDSGAIWLVSAGTDGTFSNPFITNGTSLVGSGDYYLGGIAIDSSNNNAGGSVGSIAPTFTISPGTGNFAPGVKLGVFYIKAPTAVVSLFDLSTGNLKSGAMSAVDSGAANLNEVVQYKFATANVGKSLNYASYLAGNSSPETVGGGLAPTTGWIMPADGLSGVNLSVFTSNDPSISGATADFPLANGALDFANSISIIPEPSTASLMAIAAMGLIALRVRRKS